MVGGGAGLMRAPACVLIAAFPAVFYTHPLPVGGGCDAGGQYGAILMRVCCLD